MLAVDHERDQVQPGQVRAQQLGQRGLGRRHGPGHTADLLVAAAIAATCLLPEAVGAAIAADGEVAAGAWAPTLLGMVAGDVDIRVGVPSGALAYPEAGRDSGVELGPAPRTG